MQVYRFIAGAVFFLALVAGCSSDEKSSAQNQPSGQAAGQSGGSVTAFASWTAQDTRGDLKAGSEWVGKQPTVINFWGTWCPPCRREIPDLVRLYEEFKPQGVEVIGLALRDQPTQVQVFAQEAGMNWVMLMGNDEVLELFGPISGVPTTIFLDKDGKEVSRFVGARTYEEFKPAFEAIAKATGPTASSM